MRWMVIPAAFLVCTNWMDRLLDVYGKQKQMFIIELLSTSASVGGLSYGLFVASNVEVGVILFSAGMLVQHFIVGYVALTSAGVKKLWIIQKFLFGCLVFCATTVISIITKTSPLVISLIVPLLFGYSVSIMIVYFSLKIKRP